MTYPVGHVLDAAHTAALEASVADPELAGAHVCVDLGEVEQVTDDGVAALARCREVAARAGVHLSYRAATRAGRLALLATWSRNR